MLVACLMICMDSGAQRARNRRQGINDSIRVDSLGADTVALDTVGGKKKEPLDAPVIYEANDSIVFTEGGFAYLYGQSKVNYEKIELTSEVITMNMDSSTVYARGVVDRTGVETGLPVFKDGLEVIAHFLRLIRSIAILEDRQERFYQSNCDPTR